MDFYEISITIICLVIGYLLGSFNPGYFIGKYKGVDLREVGSKNLGTANVYWTLGKKYAAPTAFYDTFKSLFAILIALLLGVNLFFAHVCGLLAIIGHIFPFYLHFKGGQGVAAATGMLLYYLLYYFTTNFFFFLFLFYILAIVAIFTYVTRSGNLLSPLVVPLLGYSVWIYFPGEMFNLFFTLILAHITGIGIYNLIHRKMIKIQDESFQTHWWRVAARPFAILFIFFYGFQTQGNTLYFIGIVALIFIAFDIYRFIHKQADEILAKKVKALIRKNEIKKFSSMTVFMVALFVTILLFRKEIAIAASVFLIFGDSFGKIFGLAFGRHKFHDKTLEGTLACAGGLLIFGYILYTLIPISLPILIIGGISAPIIEIFSMRINDNFTVPLISGSIMTVIYLLGF